MDVNGCRQNESPNSWLKHHNNPHNSSPSINVLSEKLHICKKQLDYWGVNFERHLWKYLLHNW